MQKQGTDLIEKRRLGVARVEMKFWQCFTYGTTGIPAREIANGE